MQGSSAFKQSILIAGALISLLVGAGLSTGQEVLQYFVPYCWWAFGVAIISVIIIVVADFGFAWAGHHANFKNGSEVFVYYCGPWLGKIFEWFTLFFCYCSFIVMVAGAGSTLAQQYSLNPLFGSIVMMVLAGGTVCMGLNFLVDVVSRIGILLVCTIIAISLAAMFLAIEDIPQGMDRIERIEAGEVTKGEIAQTLQAEGIRPEHSANAAMPENPDEKASMVLAAENWILSGISYGGFCILWLASFVATLGSKRVKYGPLLVGSVLSALALVVMCLIIGLAQTGNIFSVYNLQVPSLYLAKQVFAPFSHVYGLLTFLAIYSTACPLLWTATLPLATEGTPKYRVITGVLAVIGFAIAAFTPYNILLNYIYVLNGYLGSLFLIIMIVRLIIFKFTGPPKFSGETLPPDADVELESIDDVKKTD